MDCAFILRIRIFMLYEKEVFKSEEQPFNFTRGRKRVMRVVHLFNLLNT